MAVAICMPGSPQVDNVIHGSSIKIGAQGACVATCSGRSAGHAPVQAKFPYLAGNRYPLELVVVHLPSNCTNQKCTC